MNVRFDGIHTLQPTAGIPSEVIERAKYLILDGIGCALMGNHVPRSEQLADAMGQFETPRVCRIIGYENRCRCFTLPPFSHTYPLC